MVQLLRNAAAAAAGNNFLIIQPPTNCHLKRVEVNTSNDAGTAYCSCQQVYLSALSDTNVTVHLISKEPVQDGEVVSWDGDILLNKMCLVKVFFSGCLAGDNVIMTILVDGES